MRRLVNCPNCSPSKDHKAIFDYDYWHKVRTCRACGQTQPFATRQSAKAKAMDALLAELTA